MPTNAEIAFYVFLVLIGLILVIIAKPPKNNSIDMTWEKKRDIERAERRWNK